MFFHHAQEAYRAQPENPKALAALATVKLAEWKWDDAYAMLKQANRINPSEPSVYFQLGKYYMLFLQFDKVYEAAKKMVEIDPMGARTLAEAARIMVFINKPDEALSFAVKSLALDPNNFLGKQMIGYCHYLKGENEKALEIFEDNFKIVGEHPYMLLALILGNWASGKIEKAREVQMKLIAMQETGAGGGLEILVAYTHLIFGDMEKFYPFFDRGIEEKNTWAAQMYGDSFSKRLRTDSHVIEARKKIGLPVFE
jgi:tetratricopeptide (TPR) repeat protein